MRDNLLLAFVSFDEKLFLRMHSQVREVEIRPTTEAALKVSLEPLKIRPATSLSAGGASTCNDSGRMRDKTPLHYRAPGPLHCNVLSQRNPLGTQLTLDRPRTSVHDNRESTTIFSLGLRLQRSKGKAATWNVKTVVAVDAAE
jgi:hypothetical protein